MMSGDTRKDVGFTGRHGFAGDVERAVGQDSPAYPGCRKHVAIGATHRDWIPLQAVKNGKFRQKRREAIRPPPGDIVRKAAQNRIPHVRDLQSGSERQAKGNGAIGDFRREFRLVDVHSDADYDGVAVAFAEDSAQFSSV